MNTSNRVPLRLYRNLLKQGKQFPDYELKQYITRRTKDDFRTVYADLKGEAREKQIQFGHDQLALIKRQATIRSMYIAPKSVVELSQSSKQ